MDGVVLALAARDLSGAASPAWPSSICSALLVWATAAAECPRLELMARVETIVDGGWRQSPCAPEQRRDLVCLALQEIAWSAVGYWWRPQLRAAALRQRAVGYWWASAAEGSSAAAASSKDA